MSTVIESTSPLADGAWPTTRTSILDWLVNETRSERFVDNIFGEFCLRLRERGVPVGRAILMLRINHPLWAGAIFHWRPGMKEAELMRTAYSVLTSPQYLNSPIKAIHDGADGIRQRLDGVVNDTSDAYSVFQDLRQEGLTDYMIWPLQFSLGQRHVVSFAADRAGGFSAADLELITDLLPALALVTEIRQKNRMARTFLQTYVGPHASEQIMAGAITRGSGSTVSAVILICDMRGFTSISELWPRDDVISLLNDYFDAMSQPIEEQGGEILKFMGDGLLAIFPLRTEGAFARAIRAVLDARVAMAALNEKRRAAGMDALGYGIGVHAGDVMYGNIGSRARLDFTVIGPAVNVASRLESLTKEVPSNELFSGTFVAMAGITEGLTRIGSFPLRGVGEPVEVYALAEP